MTFEERKALAIAIMDSKKMWKSNYAPPLLRGLWKLGLKIPPFPFIPFWKNFVGFGSFFGIGWGTIMWFVSWKDMEMFPHVAVIFSSIAGIFFGFWMAGFHWWRKRVNKLPDWKDLEEHRDKNIIQ
jgi:hypothetical protein